MIDTVLKVLVPIFTIISISSKWYRSSKHQKHRWLGYLLQSIPVCFWLFYFIVTKQAWICLITLSNAFFICRGIFNNKNLKETKLCN